MQCRKIDTCVEHGGTGRRRFAYQRHNATGGPPDAERCYTLAFLERAFADFASIEIAEYDRVLAEGTWHVGKSALIDLVGVK